MMDNQTVIKTLNKLLQGQYMGVHSYEEFIKNLDDSSVLRNRFIAIQKDLKHHANLLSERIQELHGSPETSEKSLNLVHSILDKQREHIDYLKSELH